MSKYDDLVAKLREIFQIDRPELDFGVYRILNARADEIDHYLSSRLKERVADALATGSAANVETQKRDLEEAIKAAQGLGVDPESTAKVKELRAAIAAASSGASEHEDAVFSHLLTFFSRYYDKGDFISQRRYKGDTYAIPYAGEEVVLHWANEDQYYTKSGEAFSNYAFRLDDGRKIQFRLIAADTAKDNRKDSGKERRFALAEERTLTRVDEDGEEYEEAIVPISDEEGDLIIRFEYCVFPPKTKQEDLVDQAVASVLGDENVRANWQALMQRVPTDKKPDRTLLEKHLTTYTQKNTADYFIHKDLGRFLRRELDFYIKNEVMNLDDVQNAEAFKAIEKALRTVQCLRGIAQDVIIFLSSLEDFQKRLWLKTKFVVAAHYCVTLDQVPVDLYPAIATNAAQWAQWHDLGMRDSDKRGSVEDLKAEPFLMVDTSLFDAQFRADLLKRVPDLTAYTDGLLVHGDNFQAITLLKPTFNGRIKAIYADPPYNTDSSEIMYKNGYRSSSWASLLANRLQASKPFLSSDGVICVTIDDEQQKELAFILEEGFGRENFLGSVTIRINPSGRITLRGFAQCHEYAIFYGNSQTSAISKVPRSDDQLARFNQSDQKGQFEWRNFRREGSASERSSRPKRFFPLYVKGETFRVPPVEWNASKAAYDVLENPEPDETCIYPIDAQGTERVWRWGLDRIAKEASDIVPKVNQRGELQVYYKYRPNEEGILPPTIWTDKKYSATEYGTGVLKSLFGSRNEFSFPKSIFAVEDTLRISLGKANSAWVIDYFAGSGTTGHAIINLNRADSGKRKYILVEQGDYFVNVLKPRIQKSVYSTTWKDGKAKKSEHGVSHCFKIIKLESYEDTLNNLELKRETAQQGLLDQLSAEGRDDYLMRYMLDIEARGSLLSVQHFTKPFDFELNVAVDSAGAFESRKVDLVETFNYLIGLTVKSIDIQLKQGFVTVEGTLPTGERTLVLWRDCELVDYKTLTRLCDKLAINPADSEYDVVYINGDHNIPSVLTSSAEEGEVTRVLKLRQIEPAFLEAMFSTEVDG